MGAVTVWRRKQQQSAVVETVEMEQLREGGEGELYSVPHPSASHAHTILYAQPGEEAERGGRVPHKAEYVTGGGGELYSVPDPSAGQSTQLIYANPEEGDETDETAVYESLKYAHTPVATEVGEEPGYDYTPPCSSAV